MGTPLCVTDGPHFFVKKVSCCSQTIKFKIPSLQKSEGNQSHKGGCPQDALILFSVTVLGSSLNLVLVVSEKAS